MGSRTAGTRVVVAALVAAAALAVGAPGANAARRCGGAPLEVCFSVASGLYGNQVTNVNVYTTNTLLDLNNVYARIILFDGSGNPRQLWDKNLNLRKATYPWWSPTVLTTDSVFCNSFVNQRLPNNAVRTPCALWPKQGGIFSANWSMGLQLWWGSNYFVSLTGSGQRIDIIGPA